jgi:hypothetical protein
MDSLNHCLLAKISSRELHVKFMDIGWQNGHPTPLSQLDIRSVDTAFSIVPVIFITNEVFRKISREGISELVRNVIENVDLKVATSSPAFGTPKGRLKAIFSQLPTEWQIDCDWTKSTQGRYFQFLRELKALIGHEVELSVTVRLHQFLNQSTQGIPPVDRGVLMAYNVGELDDPTAVNTILDTMITANYLRPHIRYPLRLDLALPYYQWGRIYRDGELLYLSNELTPEELIDHERFKLATDGSYTIIRTTYLRGYALYSGDLIRLERSEPGALRAIARQLQIIPSFPGQRLIFYHLGSSMSKTCDDGLLRELSTLVSNQ